MSKLDNLKQALKNPPPERLAKIEYRSHLYQGFGILFVCSMLIYKGYWYIIFALIFGLGISYSQGMTAYNKYNAIMSIVKPEQAKDFEKDISFTRRRSKIINHVIPYPKLLTTIVTVLVTVLIIDPNLNRWALSFLYPLTMLIIYVCFYYFVLYWISYPFYKKEVKGK